MMPLWLLGLLVAGGISLIVYLVHAGGGSVDAVLANENAARDRWAEDFPDLPPVELVLSQDGTAAVLRMTQGVGLIAAVGDCFITRALQPADIAMARADGAVINLRLHDFTYSGGSWRFESELAAKRVVEWLQQNKEITHA
jgi:hypothetical protein